MLRLSRRSLNYFLIGPPGSGKSTLGAGLAKKLGNYRLFNLNNYFFLFTINHYLLLIALNIISINFI